MKLVLVTGANGFVGGHMCEFLSGQGYSVRRAIRSVESYAPQSDDDVVSVGSISADTDWSTAVSGVDAVVHLAARVHVLSESSEDPLTAFREVNSLGTMRLAKQAAEAGVRRFVYMSSIKAGVAGELNSDDPYGQSKLEAEQELFRFAATEQLEPVVVRPPLVYGPGVGANFLRLLKIIELGVPLPFRSVENHRSLVAIENLCDFVAQCLDSDAAVGEVFDVSDGDTVSTPELLANIAAAMERRIRLFSLPPAVLRFLFAAVGRSNDYERLLGSLFSNIDNARHRLGWSPPVSMKDSLQRTVAWYNDEHQNS